MTEREEFSRLKESFDQMLAAEKILKDNIISLILRRVRKIGEGAIGISLVVLERHDVTNISGNLVQYIEVDQLRVYEDGTAQLTGCEPDTDDIIVINLEELTIVELMHLTSLIFGEEGHSYTIVPLEDAGV